MNQCFREQDDGYHSSYCIVQDRRIGNSIIQRTIFLLENVIK